MWKVLVIVPFPFDQKGLDLRSTQASEAGDTPDVTFEFRGVKAGPMDFMGLHDEKLIDIAVFEAGVSAQDEGFDAVCVDTLSDSGVAGLRSVLDIPVIGPGKSALHFALMLGTRVSILVQIDPDIPHYREVMNGFYRRAVRDFGIEHDFASLAMFDLAHDFENLYTGKEDVAFPLMLEACERAIHEDGADVICLGSTTMHQAGDYLSKNLSVPIVNPGPVSYQIVAAVLRLGLSHSRVAYPKPVVRRDDMLHAMMLGAQKAQ